MVLNVTATVPPAPAASVPPVGETENHPAGLANAQVNVLLPVFVTVKNAGFGVNGPPTGPLAANVAGLICKSSGRSNFCMTPVVVELEGTNAVNPIPRLAKAAHNAKRLAPPVYT